MTEQEFTFGNAGLQAFLHTIENDRALFEEKNFIQRAEAMDLLEFYSMAWTEETMPLQQRAETLKQRLEKTDQELFQKLREKIRQEESRGDRFRELVAAYIDLNAETEVHSAGYTSLDLFINGLLAQENFPVQTKELEPGMVYYQKTPARIVFEFVQQICFTKEDVFYDIGSGLGQAAVLVHLLSGIPCRGIEFEPAFCAYANDCARKLGLEDVQFINEDARSADYSAGTVFFMFTPFKGVLLDEVLELLRKEALQREIRIITYGPCTAEVTLQGWLHSPATEEQTLYRPCIFTSRQPLLRQP